LKPKSILETKLTEGQQAQLADWLLSGVPYHQAAAMVEKEFGLKVSISAFSRFYQSNCSAALLSRRMRAVKLADEVAVEARSHPGQFTAATIDQLSQKAFELASSPGANPQDVKALFSLVLKSRDQDLVERRVKLLEAKAAQADEASAIAGSGTLSPEEKAQRIKAVFGLS
jgi:hypothetical protein